MTKRVLFLYPNKNSELRIPLAISILIACIKKAGHEVRLFDTTFFGEFHTDNEKMEKLGTHLHVDLNIKSNNLDPKIELKNLISTYNPDFIFTSLVERNLNNAKELLKDIDIPVLGGGIMPTIAPEYILSQDWVDYICVGEGEREVVEFLKDPKSILSPRELISLDDVPEQDWIDFDQRHLLKPFMGKVYRGGSFEFSRGCLKSCAFCVAPKLRERMKGGNYHRTKTPEKAIKEIARKVRDYNLEMISFGDTDFLSGVPKSVMWEFLARYKSEINLPFTIQASAETLTDETTLDFLRQAKCCAISVGVESGSDKIRKAVIKKSIPLELVKKAVSLCRKYDLRVTANYMVGLPYEEESDVRQTIEFNRLLNPPSIAVTYFTPFMGTELYDVCVKEGFYRPFEENVYEYPPLQMPQLSQERIKDLVKEFTDDFKGYQKDINVLS